MRRVRRRARLRHKLRSAVPVRRGGGGLQCSSQRWLPRCVHRWPSLSPCRARHPGTPPRAIPALLSPRHALRTHHHPPSRAPQPMLPSPPAPSAAPAPAPLQPPRRPPLQPPRRPLVCPSVAGAWDKVSFDALIAAIRFEPVLQAEWAHCSCLPSVHATGSPPPVLGCMAIALAGHSRGMEACNNESHNHCMWVDALADADMCVLKPSRIYDYLPECGCKLRPTAGAAPPIPPHTHPRRTSPRRRVRPPPTRPQRAPRAAPLGPAHGVRCEPSSPPPRQGVGNVSRVPPPPPPGAPPWENRCPQLPTIARAARTST